MSIRGLIAEAQRLPRPFTVDEVRGLATPRGIEAAVARGELVRVAPGHYASALHSESWSVRSLAACAWMPSGSALTGRGALFERGILEQAPDVADVVVPRGCHRRGPDWVRVVSQTHPISAELMPRGTVTADAPLALIHAFAREPEYSRESLVYGACAAGRIDPGTVTELVDRLPRVRGRRRLVRLLGNAADGIESHLELQGATTVLTGAAFANIVRQHRLTVRRDSYRVDAYDPPTRTAFEFDGGQWHSRPSQRVRDLRRDAVLTSAGIATVRFGYWDVVERPQWCRAIALRTLAERAA
ncbi:hypothetical protein [Demequina muriae]|uniref:Transcriptional regulator, AbiEi antitoxin, Type IV TA system n=1 Tax=Demequina muriae TaxID=3051664 RepID=A0ABT8GGU0_9MICO|nr:hypothetical protein [Demequina sp. EGI L300058]MDN4480486.1 hypothetical protein [Demequina sp. EGI L300058]